MFDFLKSKETLKRIRSDVFLNSHYKGVSHLVFESLKTPGSVSDISDRLGTLGGLMDNVFSVEANYLVDKGVLKKNKAGVFSRAKYFDFDETFTDNSRCPVENLKSWADNNDLFYLEQDSCKLKARSDFSSDLDFTIFTGSHPDLIGTSYGEVVTRFDLHKRLNFENAIIAYIAINDLKH